MRLKPDIMQQHRGWPGLDAVANKSRLIAAPDIPTVDEAGSPGFSHLNVERALGASGHALGTSSAGMSAVRPRSGGQRDISRRSCPVRPFQPPTETKRAPKYGAADALGAGGLGARPVSISFGR
jgi:hypothetical protein